MEVREANDEFACRLGIISSGLSRIDQYRRFCLPVSSPARTRDVPPIAQGGGKNVGDGQDAEPPFTLT